MRRLTALVALGATLAAGDPLVPSPTPTPASAFREDPAVALAVGADAYLRGSLDMLLAFAQRSDPKLAACIKAEPIEVWIARIKTQLDAAPVHELRKGSMPVLTIGLVSKRCQAPSPTP